MKKETKGSATAHTEAQGETSTAEAPAPLDGAAVEALIRKSLDNTYEVFGDDEGDFVTALRDLKKRLGVPDGATVVYPGSSTHVGVARVFGKEQVTHVDPQAEVYKVLGDAGYLAEATGIEDYSPETKADLIVALNSYGSPTADVLRRVLKPGGLVIANNYTHWANELCHDEGVSLVGAVMPNYGKDGQYVEAASVPAGATDMLEVTYHFKNGQLIDHHDPEGFSFTDEEPNFPDALFVFQLAK